MPRTKKKPGPAPQAASSAPPVVNGPVGEILTLGEAAAYLRLPEADVRRLVAEQGLPARQLGDEWRFLKSAIQTWLSTPLPKGHKQGIWATAGMLKDDPYLEEMLKEINRMRGRPTSEESGLPKENKEGIWAAAGSWKDDPYLDDMLKEIYRKRGRRMTEE